MKRIIGIPIKKTSSSKTVQAAAAASSAAPKPTLPDIVSKMDGKAEDLDKKISNCDLELKKISTRLQSLAEGSIKNALKSKAYALLQRKKRFEQQSELVKQQSFNLEQASSKIEATTDAVTVVKAMKTGVKGLKKTQEKIDVNLIEDLQDEMENLLEKADDVQEVLAKTAEIPEIDDQELQEQLDLLGDDFVADDDTTYLDVAITGFPSVQAKGQGPFNNGPGLAALPQTSSFVINKAGKPDSGSTTITTTDECRAPDAVDFTKDPLLNEELFNSAKWGSPFNAKKAPFR